MFYAKSTQVIAEGHSGGDSRKNESTTDERASCSWSWKCSRRQKLAVWELLIRFLKTAA